MEKPWYKSMAVWGAVMLFVGAGLEALGFVGAADVVAKILVVFGIPVVTVGIRRAIK